MTGWNTGSWRIWFFRGLVAVAASLMVTSFAMPWWIANFSNELDAPGTGNIWIYGWGLRHNLTQLSSHIADDVTPFYQTVLAWVYVAAIAGLALLSTWLKGWKGRLLLGGIGIIHIAYAAIAAFIVIANRTGDFGISLQGLSLITYGGAGVDFTVFYINANLQFWYWLAYAAGGMFIVLALLRGIITGKTKPCVHTEF